MMNETQKKIFYNLLIDLNKTNEYINSILKTNKNSLKLSNIDNHYNEFPYITKKEIKDNYYKYISDINNEEQVVEMTSGSTGSPLRCLKTKKERLIASFNLWKCRKEWDENVNINNFIPLVGYKTYHEIGDFCNFEYNNMINCFNILMDKNPRWISGPISTVEKYADLIISGKVNYNNEIKFIELAGEHSESYQREKIEKAFNAVSINQYGTRECWCIAYECPNNQLHVLDNIFLETIDTEVLGDNGEIVVTSLFNKLMPIIKYNLHDLGSLSISDCECGKKGQVLQLAGGRTSDIIEGSKEMLGDIFFKRIVCDLILETGNDFVNIFRVEQTKINYFKIYLVKSKTFEGSVIRKLKSNIIEGLQREVEIEIIFEDDILFSTNGKLKVFQSKII